MMVILKQDRKRIVVNCVGYVFLLLTVFISHRYRELFYWNGLPLSDFVFILLRILVFGIAHDFLYWERKLKVDKLVEPPVKFRIGLIVTLLVFGGILLWRLLSLTGNKGLSKLSDNLFLFFGGTLLILLAAVGEEFIFKGCIFRLLTDLGLKKVIAVFAVSLLFAIAHLGSESFVFLFAFSLISCFCFLLYPSLIPSIAFHFLYNYLNFLMAS